MSARHIVIIGNGISGITLARHLRKKSADAITVISGESDHFFSRPALMYVYMGHMPFENTKPYEDDFWTKNRIALRRAYVSRVDISAKKIDLDDRSELSYDVLVIATGSHPNMGNWHGNHFDGVQGLVRLADLEMMERNTEGIRKAVVAGGGLIGVEMAEMLRSRGIAVTFLVREFKFWNNTIPAEEADLIERHMIADHHVDLRLHTELQEIKGDEQGRVRSVVTQSGEEIPCEFLGITIGVNPTIDFLEGSGIETARGVLVNTFFETNVKDVYAIGDCAEFRQPLNGRQKIEQIWYTGRMHGETLAQTLAGKRCEYRPVNFFNSAKLFDIEFQVYCREVQIPADCESLYWFNYKNRVSMRLFFHPQTRRFEGVLLLGIRFRHEVCDRWLREERSVEYVLEHLRDANFDPEFFPTYEQELIDLYQKKTGTSLHLKKRNWSRIFGWSIR